MVEKIILGEVWLANLSPIKGHEQDGTRPVLIVSNEVINDSKADLVIIIPATTEDKGIPTHINIKLKEESYFLTEQIRSISKNRLIKKLGKLNDIELDEIKDMVKFITF